MSSLQLRLSQTCFQLSSCLVVLLRYFHASFHLRYMNCVARVEVCRVLSVNGFGLRSRGRRVIGTGWVEFFGFQEALRRRRRGWYGTGATAGTKAIARGVEGRIRRRINNIAGLVVLRHRNVVRYLRVVLLVAIRR